jgi:GAF domain-containing protein
VSPTATPSLPDPMAAASRDARADERVELNFPDLPRLELDQLLEQLVDRAQEVMATQDRLRGLLRAVQLITGDLDLPTVVRHIAEAARELVGARYAALGVIAPDGHLAQFVHTGMPDDVIERIGRLPQGKGLLGALIDDPHPIRLHRIADDVRSTGFPPGHPPMDGFLGVPVRVREEVFGNLYLAESTKGEFTADDEELAKALAASAAAAIENARLYEAAQQRQDWLHASAAITQQLLATDTADQLPLLAASTRKIADADLVTVVRPVIDNPDNFDKSAKSDGVDEHFPLHIAVADGLQADRIRGMRLSLRDSLSGQVFTSRQPMLVAGPDERPELATGTAVEMDIGLMLLVPMLGSHQVHGVLTAGRRTGGRAFTTDDLAMLAGLANQACVAIELADARAEQQLLALLNDRDRIAADLHDHVIKQLFGTGLTLHSIAATLGNDPAALRIRDTVTTLDATIGQIRTSIFALTKAPTAPAHRCQARMLDVITEHEIALGSAPDVRFGGPLDTLPDDFVDDLVSALHATLSTVAEGRGDRLIDIAVTAADRITLEITDTGTHDLQAPPGGSARETTAADSVVREGATARGGTFTRIRHDHGNTLCWTVPTP